MDSHDVRREWAERSGAYSPAYYAHHGPDSRSETVRRLLERHVGTDARILEVGCSAGRHLAHLHEAGFKDLAGVELNGEAFEVMAANYPDLYEAGQFHHETIETAVERFEDGAFDAVYSIETLQHIHPEESWVFEALARVAGELVLTVENEGEDGAGVNHVDGEVPLYYRDWGSVFTGHGLEQVAVGDGGRDTVRVFRSG